MIQGALDMASKTAEAVMTPMEKVAVLCCAALCCGVLRCAVLWGAVGCCAVLCCAGVATAEAGSVAAGACCLPPPPIVRLAPVPPPLQVSMLSSDAEVR